jgi:Xaa-Pro aminopeptidase
MGGRASRVNRGGCRAVLFRVLVAAAWGIVAFATIGSSTSAQQRREREPNSVYAARRAKLAAEVDAPIVLWGYTGREEYSEAAIFAQEENFYYLTGHNEEDAAVVIFPASKSATGGGAGSDGKSEILFLPPKDTAKEKWNGLRMSPTDPGIEARTGFASVQPISELIPTLQKIATTYPEIYTVLPYETEMGGYPHEKDEMDWLDKSVPGLKRADIREKIAALRQIKSPGELLFLKRAVELSDDAHLEAMKMMRPGLYEYQIAAKMVEVHLMGGSEAEGYSPIVGAGPNSTALHYDKLSRKIEDGDIVVLDVGAQYSGYSNSLRASAKSTKSYLERRTRRSRPRNPARSFAAPAKTACSRSPTTTSTHTAKTNKEGRSANTSFMG